MTIAMTGTELRRCSDLAIIRRAIENGCPDAESAEVGLTEIAELCSRHAATRPGRDWYETRDHILMIGAEWDLGRDRLDAQPEACLRCLAEFLV